MYPKPSFSYLNGTMGGLFNVSFYSLVNQKQIDPKSVENWNRGLSKTLALVRVHSMPEVVKVYIFT